MARAGRAQESSPVGYNEGDALIGLKGGPTMSTTATELTRKHCVPCEGGIPALGPAEVKEHLAAVPAWKLTADGRHIRRDWRVKDFATALDFFNRVGQIAEAEDHHPDLHLTGYRQVAIEMSTHAVNGLTENDFILAAKIDMLPVELKK
jgi:4a-hydroxytetrahydrobiopterin dehydratase